MKRYWMTTKWPNYKGKDDIGAPHEGVWGQEHAKPVLERCKVGDTVFIYEAATGPIRIEGDEKVKPYRGKMGIVDVVKVSSAIKENLDTDYYANRAPLWWRYYRETEAVKHLDTPIPLAKVNEVLVYSPNCVLRSFGERHSGLKELTVAQAKVFMQSVGLDL